MFSTASHHQPQAGFAVRLDARIPTFCTHKVEDYTQALLSSTIDARSAGTRGHHNGKRDNDGWKRRFAVCPHVRAALRRYREKQPVLGWDNNGRLREHSLPPLLFLIDSKHAEEIQMIFRRFWAALTACSTKRPIINPGLTFTVRIDGRIPYSSILCLILGTNNVKRAAKRSSSAESMHAGTRNRHLEM
jgi:hypothetical protein